MYSVYADNICIYNDLNPSGLVNALTPKLKLADNNAGSLEITLPVGNKGYDYVERLKTEIIVKRFDEDIWAGRVISEKANFQNSRILTCEGELAYFNDTTQPPTKYENTTVENFLTAIINIHNANVSSEKQIKIDVITVHGEIDAETELETGTEFITNDETTFKVISEKLIDVFGGHIRIRRVYDENGILHRHLDYLADYPDTSSQEIIFGRNLLDFTRDWDASEYATVILPRGAKLDTSDIEGIDAYLDVSDVNGGSRYVTNEDAISEYGWIEKVVDWEDVTDADELLEKARTYIEEEQFDNMVLEVSAIDLRYLIQNEQPINLLDQVYCISRPHGLNKPFPVTELNIQLDSPENSKYTLGSKEEVSSLTGSTREANKEILSRIEKMPTEKSILNKAKDNATAIMNMATNGFITIVKDVTTNTHSESLIISNTVDYTQATRYWKWNVNGLGYTANGGETFGLAMTMDGAIVADYITAGTMSANRIRTGILEDEGHNTEWNLSTGVLTMRKGSITLGNGLFSVNDNGYLIAENGKIGGFTISAYSIYNDAIKLNSGGLAFQSKNGNTYEKLGTYSSSYWDNSPSHKGLAVDMEFGNSYIAWAHKDNSSDSVYTVKLMYTSVDLPYNTPPPERGKYLKSSFTADRLNLGCDLDGNNYSAHYLIIDPTTCRILKDNQTEGATSNGASNNVYIPTFIPSGLGINWQVWKMKNGLIYKS